MTHPIPQALKDMVTGHDLARPRSQQLEVGPSEVGTACWRQLAWKRGRAPVYNQQRGSWGAYIGTATHASLTAAAKLNNQVLGRERWITDHRITIRMETGDDLSGELDLYDTDNNTVIDHKIVGPSTLKKAKSFGPGPEYETQVQIYAAGMLIQGYPVEHVAIMFWPRAYSNHDHVYWTTPYDESKADEALRRLAQTDILLDGTRHEDAARKANLLETSDANCQWCPAFTGSNDLDGLLAGPQTPLGCQGHQ